MIIAQKIEKNMRTSYERLKEQIKKRGKTMVYGVYAIQDVLVGFHAPMVGVNDAQMKRDYKGYATTQKNSEDLRLFKIGEFNDATGKIEGLNPIECIEGGVINASNED